MDTRDSEESSEMLGILKNPGFLVHEKSRLDFSVFLGLEIQRISMSLSAPYGVSDELGGTPSDSRHSYCCHNILLLKLMLTQNLLPPFDFPSPGNVN